MYYTFWMFMKRKPRENIQVCHNVSPTSYRQVTDILPTHYQLSPDCRPTGSLYFGQNLLAVCRPTVGQQSADCWSTHGRQSANSRPTVGRQTADSWPTVDRQVFWGGLLHNYHLLYDFCVVPDIEPLCKNTPNWKSLLNASKNNLTVITQCCTAVVLTSSLSTH